MFIQTEATPNPSTLKFLPGKVVLETGTAEFRDETEARAASPLAARLFGIPGVKGVFLGYDFITVTKDDADWQHMKPAILGAIMEHFQMDRPLVSEAAAEGDAPGTDAVLSEEDEDIVEQIIELIETRVRPAVANDGGDIVYRGFQRGVVFLQMQGACSGCPSSSATLKNGIEQLLKHYVPEVTEVRAA